MQPETAYVSSSALDVSILTRPGGRVQHSQRTRSSRGTVVSILTRPGGRVQLAYRAVSAVRFTSFNPHPSRRTGATGANNTVL